MAVTACSSASVNRPSAPAPFRFSGRRSQARKAASGKFVSFTATPWAALFSFSGAASGSAGAAAGAAGSSTVAGRVAASSAFSPLAASSTAPASAAAASSPAGGASSPLCPPASAWTAAGSSWAKAEIGSDAASIITAASRHRPRRKAFLLMEQSTSLCFCKHKQ